MDSPPDPDAPPPRHAWRRFALILLLVPFIGTLWVASYASLTPRLWGIPFFYWYQLLWIVISAALTMIVYAVDRS